MEGGENPELYGIREGLKEAQYLGERQQGLDPMGQEGRMQTFSFLFKCSYEHSLGFTGHKIS